MLISTYRLRSSVSTRTDRLPGSGTTLEVPERLRKLQRLNDNALLLLTVTQLRVSRQGEVLAQRVAIKAVVGHDTTQIGVAGEEDTEHVVHLTLVPQSTLEQTGNTGHGAGLVGVGLDTDTRVVAHTEHVVDDLEALVAGGEVDTGDVRDLSVFGRGVVFQESHGGDEAGGRDVDAELILPDGELLDVLGQARHDVLAVLVQTVRLVLVLVGRVDDGGAERARSYGIMLVLHILRYQRSNPGAIGHTGTLGLAHVGNIL